MSLQTTYTLDELELPLILRGTMTSLADVVMETAAELDVEYNYEPGQHEIIRADPNDSQPGFADSVEVWKVVATAPILFDNEGITLTLAAGFDLTELLPKSVICQIEHDLITGIRNHRRAA